MTDVSAYDALLIMIESSNDGTALLVPHFRLIPYREMLELAQFVKQREQLVHGLQLRRCFPYRCFVTYLQKQVAAELKGYSIYSPDPWIHLLRLVNQDGLERMLEYLGEHEYVYEGEVLYLVTSYGLALRTALMEPLKSHYSPFVNNGIAATLEWELLLRIIQSPAPEPMENRHAVEAGTYR